MKSFVCIVCPKGCRLQVDPEAGTVSGNDCKRGEVYGLEEATHPTRVITSTVKIAGAALRRCPVKLSAPIPKENIQAAMALLDGVCLKAPVALGAVAFANVCDTGVDFVTTRSMPACDKSS